MIENLFTSHLAYITIKEVGTHHTIEKFHGKKIAFESISPEKKSETVGDPNLSKYTDPTESGSETLLIKINRSPPKSNKCQN